MASILLVCSSQGQQATATPADPAASDSTKADNTQRIFWAKQKYRYCRDFSISPWSRKRRKSSAHLTTGDAQAVQAQSLRK